MSGAMNVNAARVLLEYLIDQGLATHPDDGDPWPVYLDQLPDSPDNCIVCYDTTGSMGGRDSVIQRYSELHGVQVFVRSAHLEGWLKAQDIKGYFDALVRTYVYLGNDTYYIQNINRQGDIIKLGKDSSNSHRRRWSLNVLVAVQQLDLGTAGTG